MPMQALRRLDAAAKIEENQPGRELRIEVCRLLRHTLTTHGYVSNLIKTRWIQKETDLELSGVETLECLAPVFHVCNVLLRSHVLLRDAKPFLEHETLEDCHV